MLGHPPPAWRPQYSRGRNSSSSALEAEYCRVLGGWLVAACRGKRRPPEGQVALGAQGAPRSAGASVDSAPGTSPAPKQPVEGRRGSEVEARPVGGGAGAGLTRGLQQQQ